MREHYNNVIDQLNKIASKSKDKKILDILKEGSEKLNDMASKYSGGIVKTASIKNSKKN